MGSAVQRLIFQRFGLAAVGLWFGLAGSSYADAPRVVASISPVHSLVAMVMAGVGEPRLLIRGFGSPHSYQLRPSEASDLAQADVIFWIGESLESVLVRPLSAVPEQLRIITLSENADMVVWPARAGGVWISAEPGAGGDNAHSVDHADHGPLDPHLWLAPSNASAIVRAVAETLAEIDAANAPTYRANAARTVRRIEAMAAKIDAQVAPIRHLPFVVMHDSFQYLERYFGLKAVGAVSVSPDRPPSARRLSDLRATIRRLDAACVFSEPQMQAALVETVVEGTAMRQDILDPLGAAIPPGPEAYFAMMKANSEALVRCLSATE